MYLMFQGTFDPRLRWLRALRKYFYPSLLLHHFFLYRNACVSSQNHWPPKDVTSFMDDHYYTLVLELLLNQYYHVINNFLFSFQEYFSSEQWEREPAEGHQDWHDHLRGHLQGRRRRWRWHAIDRRRNRRRQKLYEDSSPRSKHGT